MINCRRLTNIMIAVGVALGAFGILEARESPNIVTPSAKELTVQDRIKEKGHWRYQPGDSVLWAKQDFDDRSWQLKTSTAMFRRDFKEMQWMGIGWFRYHFTVDSSLVGQPLLISLMQSCASQVFLDGKLIGSFGEVAGNAEEERPLVTWGKPIHLRITTPDLSEHVLAIRYSNFSTYKHLRFPWPTGFSLEVIRATDSYAADLANVKVQTMLWMVFTAVPLAFAMLHFFLFIYYPAARANLYYAWFTFSAAVLTFVATGPPEQVTLAKYMVNQVFFRLSLVSMFLSGLLFLYTVFYRKLPGIFWVFMGVCSLFTAGISFVTVTDIYCLGFVILIEQLRIVISAHVKRKDGAIIIGIGYLLFALAASYQMLDGMNILPRPGGAMTNPYVFGVLGVLISMSLFLARSSAQTNRAVSASNIKQLETIEQLKAEMIERKRAEQIAREQQERLLQADKMASLGILVSGVAHEINNPNNFILLNSNNLSDIWTDLKPVIDKKVEAGGDFMVAGIPYSEMRDDIAPMIGAISGGADRIRKIVNTFKDFARKYPGNLGETVNVREAIEAATTILANLIKKSTSRFSVTNAVDVPPVKGNLQQIEQVLINLISNACQALSGTDKPVTVESSFDAASQKVSIVVRDEGQGMSEEDMKYIMDPFFTTKRDSGGTGLGLSISYRIITDHGGSLIFKSKLGAGTTATILLHAFAADEVA